MLPLAHKVAFTGYLRRSLPQAPPNAGDHELPSAPYILVTPGGGGDGEALIDWVLRAYETDPGIPHPALVVFGPFMHLERRLEFQERAGRLGKIHAITFESRFERLLERALGVVAMGGYNTFCEILSFGKPALLVPRTEPRQEQLLRAERAAQLGLVRVRADDGVRAPGAMVECLRTLPSWPRPAVEVHAGLLNGLERIAERAAPWLAAPRTAARVSHLA
jgi:predicted glycosyltransferase